jgi:glycosyltransferase involved in cell wall biosynthesis
MTSPRVSVVMSAYNAERALRPAVESILGQSFRDFEFIVIDDGSRDATASILEQYADPRLQVVRQENRGLTASLNRGVALSTGEYVARMDADDVAHPDRFREQVAFLDAHPDVGVVGTAYEEIDADGRIIGHRIFPTDDAALRRVLIRYNPFFHSSVMIRRRILAEVGPYDEARSLLVEDYELWFRVARVTRIANLPAMLMQRRYSGENLSLARETEQLRQGVRLRWRVLRRGDYPLSAAIHLLRPALVSVLPGPARKRLRRALLGSRI